MEKAKFNYEVNRDLVYYFDDTQIEIIYTQPGTTEKSRQHILVSDLQIDAEKVLYQLMYSFKETYTFPIFFLLPSYKSNTS